MRCGRFFGFLLVIVLIIPACGGSSDNSTKYNYVQPDRAICDTTLDVAGGFLCAISPSRLDSQARDIFGSGSAADSILGFGYHAIAFPETGTPIKGVYIHFTGSFGRPYDQNSDTYPSANFLKESLDSGYLMFQVAYHNRYAVNSASECAGSNDVDDCAGLVRREKITGDDLSAVTEVPVADSISERVIKLVQYLESQGFEFPVPIVPSGTVNWEKVRVGGHSQGAGHALFINKYFGSAHACLLGGAYDVPDTVPIIPTEDIADWYLDNSVLPDLSTIRAIVSVDDTSYSQFLSAYDLLGMQEDRHWKEFSAASYTDENDVTINGHSAAVHDPNFSAIRRTACFGDTFFE